MGYEHLEIVREGHVATLWLNRPEKLNALSEDMWADIPAAMGELDGDEEVRAVVLAGRGTSFTVGIDVGLLAGFGMDGASNASSNMALYQTIRRMQRTASCFADSPKPVIAAVHGHCLGAGMDLITACDLRLASAEANFSIRETRMGLVADIGTLQRLPGIVGSGNTAELAFTGEDIDAIRAERIGLVTRVVSDPEALFEEVNELALAISRNSPLVVAGIKKVLAANDGRTVDQALDFVAQWNASYLISNDLFEAVAAFTEKREPRFTGN
jgi:enoyl-CoA hydratase/carnithine racemase